jgi:hypothetical protein
MNKAKDRVFSERSHRLAIVGSLIAIVALFLGSCVPTPTSVPTKVPVMIPREEKTKPAGAVDCTGSEGRFTCPGLDGHTITLTGVPSGTTPVLIPVSSDEAATFSNLPKEGFTCLSIFGNLAFYDASGTLVKVFDNPVTLEMNVTANDLEFVTKCGSDKGAADLMPVFLFLPEVDTSVSIWKPFQSYKFDNAANPTSVSVEFMFWGDDPLGYGSPKGK